MRRLLKPSPAITRPRLLDQYADSVPQQLEEAGEQVAAVLLTASGSILVAAPKITEPSKGQVIEVDGAPGEIARGCAARPPLRYGRRRYAAASNRRNAGCRPPLVVCREFEWVATSSAVFTALLNTDLRLVRPERFELPAFWFVARRSIQLSYGRIYSCRYVSDFTPNLAVLLCPAAPMRARSLSHRSGSAIPG